MTARRSIALCSAALTLACTGVILEPAAHDLDSDPDASRQEGLDGGPASLDPADAAVAGADVAPVGRDAAAPAGPDASAPGPDAAAPGPDAGVPDSGPSTVFTNTVHDQANVCAVWKAGHTSTDYAPFTPGAAKCDPGTLSRAGLDDAVRRINMWRWMLSLPPVQDDSSRDASAQDCAVITANNPPGQQAHHPATTSTCYNATGAAAAGASNLAWGSGSPANAIDQFIEDWGNATTLGHRRWIFNPPLNPVGIGYYDPATFGGGYNAECLMVFGMSNTGPQPDWSALPPPGPTPSAVKGYTWSFHSNLLDRPAASDVKLTVKSDGSTVPITVTRLNGGYGQNALSWDVTNAYSTLQVGVTYHVAITNIDGKALEYDTWFVECP